MKKIFSIILCAALLMGIIPTSVFASSGALSAVQVTCDNPYLDVGQNAQLSVTLLDGENNLYEGDADITYTSLNPYVATVDSGGKITANQYGSTKITVTAQNSSNMVSKTVTVAVEKARDGVVTFEAMDAGAVPRGMAKSNLVTVSDYNGADSAQSVYLNDNSNMDTAYMHYQIPNGAKELTLDFDVYVENGVVSLALTAGDPALSANKAFQIMFYQHKTEMFNGFDWLPLTDESGNEMPPNMNKKSEWSHVHIEIMNNDAANGSAKIYVDGEYIGTAAKTASGGYGTNTAGELDGVYFSSGGPTSIADRYYIDNLSLKTGITPVGQAEPPLLDVKLGAELGLAWNTEPILDEDGNNLGDPDFEGHEPDIVNDYLDGFGFCQIPSGMITFEDENGEVDRVAISYARHRDGGATESRDAKKIFTTETLLNAEDGDDLSEDCAFKDNLNFMWMVELNDDRGKYFVIDYNGTCVDDETGNLRSRIYDPATQKWESISGKTHIDKDITSFNGLTPGDPFPMYFVKVDYASDGKTLLAAAYSSYSKHSSEGGASASYLFESRDLGKNWYYRSTIANPQDGEFYHPNGVRVPSFVEPSLQRCPDGSLLCLLRTSDYQPLWQVRSLDDGYTWSVPEKLPGAEGVGSIYPVTVMLDNGVLAATTGRLDNAVLFSLDGCGYQWGYTYLTYQTGDVTTCSGNSSMAQIAPNTLLVAGDMGHQVQNRLAGIWGKIVEVERNDRPNPVLSKAILKATSNRIMDNGSLDVRVEGIFNSNGYLIPADECQITYYSESPDILTVDRKTGKVTAASEGLARVIASVSHDGKTILTNSIAITAMNENTLQSVTFTVDDWALDVDQKTTFTLEALDVSGNTLTSGVTYAFESANPDIASVDGNGVVTGVSPGTTIITVTATKNNVSVSNKTTILVNSDKWDVSDFEGCDVGGTLPTGYKPFYALGPSISNVQANSGEKSLYFDDNRTDQACSLTRQFTSRTAAVVEYMLYLEESTSAKSEIWLGMGSGTPGNYLSNIAFYRPNDSSQEMAMKYKTDDQWHYVDSTGLTYDKWHKIRLEGCIGMPSYLYINDELICEMPGSFKNITDLTYVYFMAGSNAATGASCYIDDIKLMTFDNNTLDDITVAVDDWSLDVGQTEQLAVQAYNELGTPFDAGVSYIYQSVNPNVASVDDGGVVTGVSPGITQIRVTAVKDYSSINGEITVLVNSDTWETMDFEDCTVGGPLPDGYVQLSGSLLPSISGANPYQSEKSLHFYDSHDQSPASLMRSFDPSAAVVLEYMFYPVKSQNGLWLGMGSGAAGRYLSNISFTNSLNDPSKLRVGYRGPTGWSHHEVDMSYNQWYKIRLEGCIGMPSKLYIDDQFICEVEAFPLAAGVTLNDLTYVYFMAGSNAGKGDECYIDNIKLMSFEPNPLDSFTAALGNWALDVQQSEPIAVSAFNEKGEPISDVNYAFESADPGIASVDGDGVVTGVSPGSTMITVTATKGSIRLTHELTVMVYSDRWDIWDFEDCDVGGELPDGFSLLTGNLLPSVSDAEAYQSEKSLHFHDTSTSAPASLMLTIDSSKAAVLEYMFYPVESVNGIWLGMGSEKVGNYLSNILFDKPVADSDEMRLRYNADGWKWVDLSGMTYNNWYKIRLEGHVGMPSKLYIDDQFICEVGPYKAATPLDNLTYVYFMGGSNGGLGDNYYIDDIKLMNFDADTDTKAKLSDLTFDGKTIPGFSPDVLVYDIELPAEKKDAAFDAIAVDSESAVSIQRVSENLVLITVGSGALEQVYTINITWKNPVTDPDPDKTELGESIGAAKALREGDYTVKSWAIMKNALAEAERVYANSRATQKEIDTANTALCEAIDALVRKPDTKPDWKPNVPVDPEEPDDLQSFDDVFPGDYYYDAVNWSAENGITTGVDAYRFGPNQICTRAQAVTFLWRAAGSPEPKSVENPFNDVKDTDYFCKAVLWALDEGITQGTSDTTFSPDEMCSRSHIVTFLWRAQHEPRTSTSQSFTDVTASDYFYDAVAWASEEEITTGTSDATFSPDDPCTRAQIVTFLYRCYAL